MTSLHGKTPSNHLPWLLATLALMLVACTGDPTRSVPPVDVQSEGEHGNGPVEHEDEHVDGLVELSADKRAEIEIATGTVRMRPLRPQLETTGQVDYQRDRLAHVSPRIAGRVIGVPVSLGTEVLAGQVLATLDSIALGEARARFLAARSRESVNQETFERERGLFEERISSQRDMLDAKAAYLEARAARQAAQETLRLYGLSGPQIDALTSEVAGLPALAVRAPIAGRVVKKHVTMGELVSPEDALFTIADLDRVWIWVDVFERDLARVHEGDAVEVRVDALPERSFAGEVTYLSAEVTPETRTVRARIEVGNDERLLRPGMFAAVRVTDPHATEGHDVLAVPRAAVTRSGDESVVFRVLGVGRFRAQLIEVGRREGAWVEVLGGVAEGDVVVTEGVFFLKSELARDALGGGHGH